MTQPQETHLDTPAEQEELAHHPTPRTYVWVAVILAIVTAAEVGIYYIEGIQSLLVPMLMIFAVIKFVLVALYFMHLKFDSRMFRNLFITGIILALAVFGVVLVWFTSRGGAAPGLGT